jgi:hypothetical protein
VIHRHQRSVRGITRIAIAVQTQMVAAMWPDGNAPVGTSSSWPTGGRGRSTAAWLVRNRVSSPTITSATKSTGRQRRQNARISGQNTREISRIAWVSPALLAQKLTSSSGGVRCAANHSVTRVSRVSTKVPSTR